MSSLHGVQIPGLCCLVLATTVLPSGLAQRAGPGDGGLATQARLVAPGKVVIDRIGNIYIAERAGYRVRRVDAHTGTITTVAGTGEKGFSGDGGQAVAARFDQLSGLALDSSGNLFIGDLWNSRIRRVDARTGIVTTVIGTGTAGYSGDGGPASGAAITAAFDLVFDRDGNLIFTDTENHRIRRVDARTGIISTIAGNGRWGFSGDGGLARDAGLARPHCVILSRENDLYICDSFNHRIRRVDAATGVISTVAGNGFYGAAGDNGPAIDASITYVGGFTFDTLGSLLFTDIATHRIRRIDRQTGIVTTVAGDGVARFAGDGGSAGGGSFDLPTGLRLDSAGSILVADNWNGRVRRIDGRTGTLSSVVGSELSPETPDWSFRVTYNAVAARALNNRAPALGHPDAGRVAVTEMTYPREAGHVPGTASLFIPPGPPPSAGYPLVMLVHGRTNQEVRPRESGGMMGWARLLAASGFIAILPDHRLGTSAVSAEQAHQDLRSALTVVRAESARLHADTSRLCMVTFSDGVAPVVPLLGEARTRPRCLVAFYPIVDLNDNRLFAWTLEPESVRQRFSLLGRVAEGRYDVPTFIARAGRDRPEVNEALTRLEQQASARGASVTVVTHSSGQQGFERLTPDREASQIMQRAVDFVISAAR